MKYEVQHYTLCDGWVNCWTISDDDGTTPEVFDTIEQAKLEIQRFLADAERDGLEGYQDSDFRVEGLR